MFDKKNKIEDDRQAIVVQTMPAEFYGGVNPVIKFKEVDKEIKRDKTPSGLSTMEKKMLDRATVAGAGNNWHPANLLSNRKFIWISTAIFFALFIAGTTWYYVRTAQQARLAAFNAQQPSQNTYVTPPVETPVVTPPAAEPEPIAPQPPTPPSLQPLALDLPSSLLTDSADLDKDNLTDVAEEIFGTDSGVADTDNDGYPDGVEVLNLYNPDGTAPMRLIETDKVKDFVNPVYNYSIYYPAGWAVGNVDQNYTDVLFSALSGENVEVRSFDLISGQTFADWLSQTAPQERLDQLQSFSNIFKEKGLARVDHLVYYFYDGTHIFVLIYHTPDSEPINYRTVMQMMAQSFRISGNTLAIPLQPVIAPQDNTANPTDTISSTTAEINTSTVSATGTTGTAEITPQG